MRALLDFAIALTGAWVAVYTRGLPHDVGSERREEIDCDLWCQRRLAELERQPVVGTAVEVFLRLLLGMPADLFWRLETGASIRTKGRTSMNDTLPMRIGFLAAMLPLAILAVMGAAFMLGNGDWDNTTEHWVWRAFFVACPVIGGIGLWLCAAQPKLGMGLVLAGVATSAFLMPWMAFVTVPIGIAIIGYGFLRSRRAPGAGSGPTATAGGSRWRQLLAIIGLSVAAIVAMVMYAFSLDEWGGTRTVIFNLGALLAATAGVTAAFLLVSDFIGARLAQGS